MRRYFLFDTETGGLDPSSVSLLSLYGMILDHNLETIDRIDLKIRPDNGRYHVDVAALKVNKIDLLQHHETAISEREAGVKLKEFLFRNSGTSKLIPCGHNIGRLDIPMGERLIGADEWNRLLVYRTLDTGVLGQFFMLSGTLPETNNGSLVSLCTHYGIDTTGAHNAQVDVEMTRKLLKAMVGDRVTPT